MTITANAKSLLQLPKPLAQFFDLFPLIEHPVPTKRPMTGPTLWVHPPSTRHELLSSDVECLK